jgi:hypothetical protein
MDPQFTKKALLIEASSVRNCNDLPGARKDIENWKTHLSEGHGGSWTSIRICSAPRLADLKSLIRDLTSTAHYSLVVFSGHGYYDPSSRSNRIVLNDVDQGVSVEEFRPGHNRSITLVDACRGIESGLVGLSALNESVQNKQGSFAERTIMLANSRSMGPVPPTVEQYRNHFDAEAVKILGRALLFSCSITEGAGENKDAGGYYTSEILRAARRWHSVVDSGVQTVNEAHAAAIEALKQKNVRQNPDSRFEAQGHRLPFAVKPQPYYNIPNYIHG